MRRLDKSAEHRVAADLLFQIFSASLTLEQLSGSFRNNEIERHMRTLARTLNELRRSLHTEFASRASFDAVSPYSVFEQRLASPSEEKKSPPAPS